MTSCGWLPSATCSRGSQHPSRALFRCSRSRACCAYRRLCLRSGRGDYTKSRQHICTLVLIFILIVRVNGHSLRYRCFPWLFGRRNCLRLCLGSCYVSARRHRRNRYIDNNSFGWCGLYSIHLLICLCRRCCRGYEGSGCQRGSGLHLSQLVHGCPLTPFQLLEVHILLLRTDDTTGSDDTHEGDRFVCCKAILPYEIGSDKRPCSTKASFALREDQESNLII